MASQIKLRRDTAANWTAANPVLGAGEPGYDTTNNKLKIGNGTTAWNSLAYFDDKVTDFSAVATNIVPDADNTRDLGTPDKQWRHVYTAGGSIYLDNIKLSNVGGKFVATKVINPGEENEAEDPEDSDATSEISGGADLGNLKISGGTLGTVEYNNPSGWGSYDLYLDPGLESQAYLYIPGLPGQQAGNSLQIFNKGAANSIVQVFGRGGVQVVTNTGEGEEVFEFRNDGVIGAPDTSGIHNSRIFDVRSQSPESNQYTAWNRVTGQTGEASINTTSNDGNNDARVIAKSTTPPHVDISVRFNDTTNVWRFGEGGTLELPPGGDIVDSTGTSVLGGGSINVLDEFDIETSNVTAVAFSSGFNISSPEPGLVTVELTGDGLPTVTVPGETGTTYKGLQVSYGMVHSNSSNTELNVNKIVIHKPAQTTTEIDPTSSQDYFRVSGLGDSDVLAMFVIFGDVNGAKPLSDLQTFAQAAIDNVILTNGVEGNYNTVENMRVAFYENYATLASAANGLDLDFEFYDFSTPTTSSTTTVIQGGGAVVNFGEDGAGGYTFIGMLNGGINYKVGHKLVVLGSVTGGADGVNDAIFTVTSVDISGAITGATVTGASFSTAPVGGWFAPAANYNIGLGFAVSNINFNSDGTWNSFNLTSQGSNYVMGDQVVLLGSNIQNGVSPTNDITITITSVDGNGTALSWVESGTYPRIWPQNNISDGGNDQYDTANYINSFYAANIQYNSGNTVADGAAAFGAGSSYTFVYDTGIFGLLVTGNSSTFIETSGNSGADGSSITEAGNIYGPDTAPQTFDNAVTHINLVGDPFAGPIVTFVRPDNSNETIDILIPDNGDGAGVAIARDSNGNGIFNPYREEGWSNNTSPEGTLWNTDGWNDLSNVTSREYDNLYAAFGNGGLGNKIVGAECVMYLPDNGKYYAVKFDSWTQGGNGGGFAYTRRELDLDNLQEGIRFADGTRLKSAEGLGRVKLESPGSRRIEEVHGYKSVAVTAQETTVITFTASRAELGGQWFWFNNNATTVDDIINQYPSYGIDSIVDMEFSVDNTTWYPWNGSGTGDGNTNESAFSVFPNSISYNQGDTLYFRYKHGAQPAVWWTAADLPAGSSYFRGAVIDYHAYTGDGTIIGTIHIVDDDGEENITHTEVSSGGSNNENDDLWFVQNEGTISYRRIDKQARTLKIQWTAKVFYGSEIYD